MKKGLSCALGVLVMLIMACALIQTGGDAVPPLTQSAENEKAPLREGNTAHPCGDGVCDERENLRNCPQDCSPAGSEQNAPPTGSAISANGPRRGFILIHADPQEILNLHENYDPAIADYDHNGTYEAEDAWQALMDLVDLADSYAIPLTLQFSPPYIDFMQQPRCDRLLAGGRAYPKNSNTLYTRCLDLVMAWEENGHEISLHHHGPHHDPLKFDGYTNREVYTTDGKRACYDDRGQTCSCPQGRCYWCAPPESPLVCQEYTAEAPPGPIGSDPEWKGRIEEGPNNMMALVYSAFGKGRIRSYCSNHGEEISDIPSDPAIIYTTQGIGYLNDSLPKCIAYDVKREYHEETKYAWFYSHGPVFKYAYLEDVKDALREMRSDQVIGLVFHVNDFLKSEVNPDDPRYSRHIRLLFAYLAAPEDGGGAIRIATLSDLMLEAGKEAAPDPCVETCFTLDEDSERAAYTVPVPPPPTCP